MTAEAPMTTGAPTLFRAARVIDGSGGAAFTGDVLVIDGLIAAVSPERVEAPAGTRLVDADGLALAPGFIDMHAHSDLAVLADPTHLAKVTQGVTTEVLGQDGLSYAPVTAQSLPLIRDQIMGWNGEPAGLEPGWATVGDYLDAVDARGAAVDVAYLVPHGTLRLNVLGPEDRPAGPAAIDAMRAAVRDGMRQGAFGLSAGLSYVPGMFADTAELVALCEVVAEFDGVFAPHQRSYGAGALAGYREMIEIARASGCRLHLTHATMNFPENGGRAAELLALIDAALAAGVELSLDSYPYLAGSTTLAALLPSWAATGGTAAVLARLADPATRARIAHELEVTGSDGCHGVPVDWATIEISGVHEEGLRWAVGHTVAALAAARGTAPAELYFELLRADRLGTTILQHVGHEENVRAILQHPRHTGGSDGILVGDKPHPRAWGTFPRFLARYVREEGLLGWEEAVVHLSRRPAEVLGLRDRGRVAVGLKADLVLFDQETVADLATFERPRTAAAGIPYVMVGGTLTLDGGHRTTQTPGRALRHRRD
jgi:N-acyl-D-amino-acid deacylase